MLSYTRREALELRRDPIRLTLALLGSVHPDVRHGLRHQPGRRGPDLRRARPRPDHRPAATTRSTSPARATSSSSRRSPTTPISTAACARASSAWPSRSRPASRRDLARGRPVEIGAWIDGAMPIARRDRPRLRAGHARALAARPGAPRQATARPCRRSVSIETRFRYNPDVKSLVAMVPAVIPLLLHADPGHADGAQRGAREGAGLDHQFLRHAGRPGWSSCSASSCPTSRSACSTSCC